MRLASRRPTLRSLKLGALAAWLCLLATSAWAASEMTFRLVSVNGASAVIAATGQITENTPDRFAEFMDENPEVRGRRPVVLIDSPGGKVIASMQLGKLLRQVNASAVVAAAQADGEGGTVVTNAQCFSACVYALMGARKRIIPSASQVGIHRMFAYEAEMDPSGQYAVVHRRYDDGRLGGYLKQYSQEMGVDPKIISAAERTRSENLRILSRKDMHRWHLDARDR